MTLRLFRRGCRVSVNRSKLTATEQKFFLPLPDGIEITDLRMTFEIEKGLKSDPNTCKITTYNLAPATRAELQNSGIVIQLHAGHDGVLRPLFRGDLTFERSTPDGTEWKTLMQIGDGTRAFAHARKNRSYKGGTEIITILRDTAKDMGMTLPKNIEADPELRDQFAAGFAFSGRARDALDRLLAPYGYAWSIQGGRLQILRDDEATNAPLEISTRTGMIGSPEFGNPTKKDKSPPVIVKMLLYPEMTPGSRVSLTSRTASGTFKVIKVKHDGDTHGTDESSWTTEVELKTV